MAREAAHRRRRAARARRRFHMLIRGAQIRRALRHAIAHRLPALPARHLHAAPHVRLPEGLGQGVRDAISLGEALRAEIRRVCGVTCSVGIAPNRLLAKIGSEEHKPDGFTLMPFEPDDIARFLAPKPLGVIWGAGKKTVEALKPYGIVTCGDLQRLGRGNALVSDDLVDMAFGISDDRVYWEEGREKSVSREHTFGEDVADRATVRETLLSLVADVGRRFRRENRWARTARLKLRDASFNTITRQAPLEEPSRDDITFRRAALALFDREWPEGRTWRKAVRLIGFGVTNFQDSPDDDEPTLFENPSAETRRKRERLSDALDALRAKGLLH